MKNTLYPVTQRHIGVDYGLPVGSPLYAPRDCRVTVAGWSDVLGWYCHLRYTEGGEQYEERWTHLWEVPTLGQYRQGQVVARSGNTGLSTGPHLHRELWPGQVDLSRITRTNWDTLTRDPETL